MNDDIDQTAVPIRARAVRRKIHLGSKRAIGSKVCFLAK